MSILTLDNKLALWKELGRNGNGSDGNHSTGSQEIEPTVEYIKSLVALRFPVLLVDRVLEWTPGERIVAMKCFTANEPTFGTNNSDITEPPAALVLEAMVQVAGLTVPKRAGRYVFLLGFDNVQYCAPGERRPQFGDQMITTATATSVRSKMFIAHAESRVEGEIVLSGDVRYIYLDSPAGADAHL